MTSPVPKIDSNSIDVYNPFSKTGQNDLSVSENLDQLSLSMQENEFDSSSRAISCEEDQRASLTSTIKTSLENIAQIQQRENEQPLMAFELSFGNIEVLQLLGQGCFGVVYQARFCYPQKKDFIDVAVKINKSIEGLVVSDFGLDELKNEAKILKHIFLSDPADTLPFARYIASGAITDKIYCLVQKLCPCNLSEFLASLDGRRLSLRSVAKMVYQLVQGLDFLQHPSRRIIHGDLKPQNILYEGVGAKIRIADFGAAQQGQKPNKRGDYLVTRYYRPPEIVLGMPYDSSVDRWSVACIAFEIYTQTLLFPASNSLEHTIMFKQLLGRPQKIFSDRVFSDKDFNKNAIVSLEDTFSRHETMSFPFQDRATYFHDAIYGKGSEESPPKKQFADCIKKWLRWEPLERPLPSSMLEDPFITEGMKPREYSK